MDCVSKKNVYRIVENDVDDVDDVAAIYEIHHMKKNDDGKIVIKGW